MKQFDKWFFPEHEAHLPEWMARVNDRRDGRLIYQGSKYRAAKKYLKNKRLALDIGGHVGLWSFQMAHDFESVIAFEAMPAHAACFYKNLEGFDNVTLINKAVGAGPGRVRMETRTKGSSGDTGVSVSGGGEPVDMVPIDSYGYDDVDFIKCDLEGYEVFAMRGAADTISRCRPVIVVEQKPHTGGPKRYGISDTAAVEFLETLDYKCAQVISGDYIMVPKE